MQSSKEQRWHLPIMGSIVSCSCLVFVIIACSDAGISFPAEMIAFFGGLLWSAVWFIRFIYWRAGIRSGSECVMPFRRASFYWGIEPATLVLAVFLVGSGLLSSVRFRLSESAFQTYIEDVRAGRVAASGRLSPSHRIGLYTITETELLPNGIVRFITSLDGIDDAGFAYSSTSEPLRIGEDSYKHITGPWWHWHRSF
jgi:hypothetical protein